MKHLGNALGDRGETVAIGSSSTKRTGGQSSAEERADIRAMEDILEISPGETWLYAREAGHRISALHDVRIIQILDEFQYLNRWIVVSDDNHELEKLCYSYMGAAESKVSPQIVAGSYIGWLGAIRRHMTGRYVEWQLESLTDEEALEAVYNYAYVYHSWKSVE